MSADEEVLADWLGGQPEAFNVTDYTDEQTTWIQVGVEDLADRLLTSDWLTERDAKTAKRARRSVLDEVERRLGPVESILSLLHHRGLVNSEHNRVDVEAALHAVRALPRELRDAEGCGDRG